MNEPGLTDQACEYLATAGISAVACDFSSRNGEMTGGRGHTQWFLPRGILIVEGLTGLTEVPTGIFVALPLKLANGTGSPLRVLLLGDPVDWWGKKSYRPGGRSPLIRGPRRR